MWNNKTVSVVFPAYNEEKNIARAVSEFKAIVGYDQKPLITEIVVVDNNSKDQTAKLAKEAGATVVTENKQGYGNALQRGLKEAKGELVVLAEPDGTFIAKDIFKLLVYSEEFEMVCGTRTTREMIWEEANMGWFLRKGNWIVAKFMEVLYDTPSISDCGCTFRLIQNQALKKISADLHVGASHFLPNMVIAARMNDLTMIEVPLNYRGRVGESKITGSIKGMWKTGLAMIRLIIVSWPTFVQRRLQKKPKLFS
jgi:glycosyltransferase involved in cell wall biosynthesis